VLLARTGLSIPDIMFAVRHIDKESYCLVSIQVKTWNSRPHPVLVKQQCIDPDRFDSIVLNVSRTHFLSGSNQQNPLTSTWTETLRHYGIYHVRIIVSFSGFTLRQIQMVDCFNENYPEQPIVLICPSMDNFANLYGKLQYTRIRELCTADADPWKKAHHKTTAKPDENKIFNERVVMKLLPEEMQDYLQKIAEIAIETENIKVDSEGHFASEELPEAQLAAVKTEKTKVDSEAKIVKKRTIITDITSEDTEGKTKKHKSDVKVPKSKKQRRKN